MTRTRKLAVALTAAAAVVVPVVGAGTASAGTNGQQVAVSTYYSDKVYICGVNQNGDSVCTPTFATPGSGYYGIANWWFKGTVTIHGYNADNGHWLTATCWVKPSQPSNWTYCDGRDNRSL